jgi:outer membrane lipoprotein-sorting protein
MKRNIWIGFSLLLVLSLVLAGCGQQPTAEEIVAKMQETVTNTVDAHAVVSVTANMQGNPVSATAEIWEKAPNKVRVLVLEASQPSMAGMLMVSDGEQGWFYDQEHNQVMLGETSDLETPIPQEMLTEVQETIQKVLDVSDIDLQGEEAIAGRAAYKLLLTPKEENEESLFPGNGTATIWVDQEQWFILKATYEADLIGQGTMEVISFELNPGLSDDLFTFEVPDGAKVVDVEAQKPVPLTLPEAEEQASFELLVPESVPGNATLIEVFGVGDSIILRYDHSTEVSFSIVQGSEVSELVPLEAAMSTLTAPAEKEAITVRGYEGSAVSDGAGENTLIHWNEGGVTITIAGHITLDEALQIAESLR